jgi:hypothetical protein
MSFRISKKSKMAVIGADKFEKPGTNPRCPLESTKPSKNDL